MPGLPLLVPQTLRWGPVALVGERKILTPWRCCSSALWKQVLVLSCCSQSSSLSKLALPRKPSAAFNPSKEMRGKQIPGGVNQTVKQALVKLQLRLACDRVVVSLLFAVGTQRSILVACRSIFSFFLDSFNSGKWSLSADLGTIKI